MAMAETLLTQQGLQEFDSGLVVKNSISRYKPHHITPKRTYSDNTILSITDTNQNVHHLLWMSTVIVLYLTD